MLTNYQEATGYYAPFGELRRLFGTRACNCESRCRLFVAEFDSRRKAVRLEARLVAFRLLNG